MVRRGLDPLGGQQIGQDRCQIVAGGRVQGARDASLQFVEADPLVGGRIPQDLQRLLALRRADA